MALGDCLVNYEEEEAEREDEDELVGTWLTLQTTILSGGCGS